MPSDQAVEALEAKLPAVTADPWDPAQKDLYYEQSLARFNAAKALGLKPTIKYQTATEDLPD